MPLSGGGVHPIAYHTARRDGTTHIVMSTLEFMQRLAALVPWPRLHLVRLLRVLAPNVEPRAGGASGAAGGHRRVGARRDRVRLRARPAGAHQLGPAAQTRL